MNEDSEYDGMSVRLTNFMRGANLTLRDCSELSVWTLLGQQNFGHKTMSELSALLEERGLPKPTTSYDNDVFVMGKRIGEIRKRESVSIEDMAKRLELSLGMYKLVEMGWEHVPNKAIRLLMKEFQIDANWFLLGNDS